MYFFMFTALFAGRCATYESKPVPVRPASSYAIQASPATPGGQAPVTVVGAGKGVIIGSAALGAAM